MIRVKAVWGEIREKNHLFRQGSSLCGMIYLPFPQDFSPEDTELPYCPLCLAALQKIEGKERRENALRQRIVDLECENTTLKKQLNTPSVK
jgi:hypothetical protein